MNYFIIQLIIYSQKKLINKNLYSKIIYNKNEIKTIDQ